MRVPPGPLTRLQHSLKTAFGAAFTNSDTVISQPYSDSDLKGTGAVVTSIGTVKLRAMSSVPTASLRQTHVTSINVDAKVMHLIKHDLTVIEYDRDAKNLVVRVVTHCGATLSPKWMVFLTLAEATHWMEYKPGGMWEYYGGRSSCNWCVGG